jgi:hypothetical protein
VFLLPPGSAPERRWLAHLVRVAAGAVRSGDPFDDELPFDAASLLALAHRHRVAPLLHGGLVERRIVDPLPACFIEECRRTYYATARKNAVALETGARLRAELAAAGVPAAPLKGWALVEGPSPIYDDVGLRPMDDLDLMVARRDVERVVRLLETGGFLPVHSRDAARLAGSHEIGFHRRCAGVNVFVEVHWAWAGPESLLRGFGLSGERFLAEFCDPDPGLAGGRVPGPLGLLLFAAVHGARHAFSRWIWLLDLHCLVEAGAVDWDELLAAARALRVSRPLYAALTGARELLRTSVPKEVLAALAPGPVRRRLLQRSLAASHAGVTRIPDLRAARVAKLLLGESWWDVARTAAWAAAPGRAWYDARGEAASLGRRLVHPLRSLGGPRDGSSPQEPASEAKRPGRAVDRAPGDLPGVPEKGGTA